MDPLKVVKKTDDLIFLNKMLNDFIPMDLERIKKDDFTIQSQMWNISPEEYRKKQIKGMEILKSEVEKRIKKLNSLNISPTVRVKVYVNGKWKRLDVKRKTYKNIFEFVNEYNLMDDFNEDVGPHRTFEDYIDEYDDPDEGIVWRVLSDLFQQFSDWKVGKQKSALTQTITIN